ncbi:MAG TPA: hypothetical protein VF767_08630 [Bryobacteraceae bacterium]
MASMSSLTAKADAVVVGIIQSSASSGTVNATIDVERTVKGPVTVGSLLSVTYTLTGSREQFSKQIAHGIVFLTGSDAGEWSILPVVTPARIWAYTYIPTAATIPSSVLESASPGTNDNSSPLDRLCAELAASTEAGTLTGVDLLYLYRTSRSIVLEAAFRRFSNNPNATIAHLGLAGRVAGGELAALEAVQQQQGTLLSKPYGRAVVDEIKYYLETDNPAALRLLGEMATNREGAAEIRTAAGAVLSTNHSVATLPYLAQLLDDPSVSLQAVAVRGLARFANNVLAGRRQSTPAAGSWRYRTDQTIAYSGFSEQAGMQAATNAISFWKGWWQQHRSELAQ